MQLKWLVCDFTHDGSFQTLLSGCSMILIRPDKRVICDMLGRMIHQLFIKTLQAMPGQVQSGEAYHRRKRLQHEGAASAGGEVGGGGAGRGGGGKLA